jgi:hypothetical protein
LKKALKKALGGGLSGAAAMVLQVLLLMVRTLSTSHGNHEHRIIPYAAASDDYELSISVWYIFFSGDKNTL